MIKYRFFLKFLLLLFFVNTDCLALAFKSPTSANKDSKSPVVLKADSVDGDKTTQIITATGNVEATRDNSKLTSDIVTYNKETGWIKAVGHVKIKDLEVGKVYATEANIRNDFSSGFFLNNTMIFNDGSYLKSKRADRKSPEVTIFQRPLLSLCPNREIKENNDLAGNNYDAISIKSKEATIDRQAQTMKTTHATLRIYNVPILYTPYLKFPLPDNKRKTGFLAPSYIKNNRFGLGLITPFFVDIAPNADLTIKPKIYTGNNQFTINNEFRHLTSYGQYNLDFEVSNNKQISSTDKLVINRTSQQYRWLLNGNGKLDLSDKSSVNFLLNTAGDRNYLRDYNYSFLAYTISDFSYDHTDGRNYYGLKTVRIQELVDVANSKSAPLVLPTLNSYFETKPFAHGEKLALSSNFNAITRSSGLQYRRASFTPEVKLPVNLHGNLLNFNARIQGDIYSLENNFQNSDLTANTKQYDPIQTNYKPEISASWRLPLIQKKQSNTLLIEPIVNFVSSGSNKSYLKLPNEDSNNSELTVNNLFINNRVAGYDRNEIGQRVSYGAKTSTFNKYGQFGVTLGQSYRFTNKTQDISIRGFSNNNKSNIVGELFYKIPKRFNFIYSFQLSESNYRNDINSITADLTLDKFFIAGNYILLRRSSATSQESSQASGFLGVKVTPKLTITLNAAHDLVLKRTISKGVTFDYGGCCIIANFSIKENNSANLIKPQTSYQVNIIIRGF